MWFKCSECAPEVFNSAPTKTK